MAPPKGSANHLSDHLDDYYLPPDECYDSLDDDEMCAEHILGCSGEHRKVGGKVTDRFTAVLSVLRATDPKPVAHLT